MRTLLIILAICTGAWVAAQKQPKPTLAILPVIHVENPMHRSEEVQRRKDLAYKHAEAKLKRAGFEVLPRNHVEKLLEKSNFYLGSDEDVSETALRKLRISLGVDGIFVMAIKFSERPFIEPKNPPRGSPSAQTLFRAVTGGSINHTRLSCSARAWLLLNGDLELDDVFGEAFAGQENHAVWRSVEKVVDPWVAEFKRRKRGR